MTYYLSELNVLELQHNFDMAHQHLKKVFSKYPHRKDMEGCPCCVGEYERKLLNQGDLKNYLWKAMTTWGEESDFKHYIPQLFSFVYLEGMDNDTFILFSKLDYVQNWAQDEIQAIASWFNAFSQYKYVIELTQSIERSRSNVQAWLEDGVLELSCDFPFSIFLEAEFNKMIPFLHPELLEKFSELVAVWPRDEIDFIAYAYCFANYQIFSDGNSGIFEGKLIAWIRKNDVIMDELFWKTEDPRLQKLFSDALQASYYPT